MYVSSIPVITIDGVSGAGKGATSLLLALQLGWHLLDSGVLYRLVALEASVNNISLNNIPKLVTIAATINPTMKVSTCGTPELIIHHATKNITYALRTEICGLQASKIAQHMEIRQVLIDKQRQFRKPPGLVTDGRDMGNVIFPDAILKIFLNAKLEIRAKRRYQQLKEQGNCVSLNDLKSSLVKRDQQDRLRAGTYASIKRERHTIDTTDLSVVQVASMIKKKLLQQENFIKKPNTLQ